MQYLTLKGLLEDWDAIFYSQSNKESTENVSEQTTVLIIYWSTPFLKYEKVLTILMIIIIDWQFLQWTVNLIPFLAQSTSLVSLAPLELTSIWKMIYLHDEFCSDISMQPWISTVVMGQFRTPPLNQLWANQFLPSGLNQYSSGPGGGRWMVDQNKTSLRQKKS